MATDEQKGALLERLRGMSAADRSVLEGALEALKEQSEVRVTTIPGSANDALWSEMVALGWMSRDQALEGVPNSSVFIIPASARDEIDALLTELKRDQLPVIFSELRRELPPRIVEPVIAAGGAPSDVILMLAGIIEMVLRRWIKDELHDDFMRELANRVQDLKSRRLG